MAKGATKSHRDTETHGRDTFTLMHAETFRIFCAAGRKFCQRQNLPYFSASWTGIKLMSLSRNAIRELRMIRSHIY